MLLLDSRLHINHHSREITIVILDSALQGLTDTPGCGNKGGPMRKGGIFLKKNFEP